MTGDALLTYRPNRLWPINHGLVGWWLGQAAPPGGAIWHDVAGAHHGAMSGMDPVTDWVGTNKPHLPRVLNFDGSNDLVTVPNAGPLNVPYITCAFWFKAIFPISTNGGILAKGDSGNRQYWVWWGGGVLSIQIDGAGTGGTTALGLGTWYHIAFTYDGANKVVYKDGKQDASYSQATGTILTDNDPLLFGRLPGFSFAKMELADVRLYNRALTGAEIRVLYEDSLQGNRLALERPRPYRAPAAPGGIPPAVALYHQRHHNRAA